MAAPGGVLPPLCAEHTAVGASLPDLPSEPQDSPLSNPDIVVSGLLVRC